MLPFYLCVKMVLAETNYHVIKFTGTKTAIYLFCFKFDDCIIGRNKILLGAYSQWLLRAALYAANREKKGGKASGWNKCHLSLQLWKSDIIFLVLYCVLTTYRDRKWAVDVHVVEVSLCNFIALQHFLCESKTLQWVIQNERTYGQIIKGIHATIMCKFC